LGDVGGGICGEKGCGDWGRERGQEHKDKGTLGAGGCNNMESRGKKKKKDREEVTNNEKNNKPFPTRRGGGRAWRNGPVKEKPGEKPGTVENAGGGQVGGREKKRRRRKKGGRTPGWQGGAVKEFLSRWGNGQNGTEGKGVEKRAGGGGDLG